MPSYSIPHDRSYVFPLMLEQVVDAPVVPQNETMSVGHAVAVDE